METWCICYLRPDRLLSDPDYGVRYHAAEALHIAGRPLDADVAKKALTIFNTDQKSGIFARLEDDTHYYDRYRLNRYSELEFQELKNSVDRGGILAEEKAVTLFRYHARRMKAELRSHIRDGFVSYYERHLDKLRKQFGHENRVVLDAEKIIPFLRRRILTSATEALAKLKEKDDLYLLRHTIDNFEFDVSNSLLIFLGRFGDWNDLDRIKSLEAYSLWRLSAFSISTPGALPQKASAMVSIAQQRIADLLAVDFSSPLRRAILQKLYKNEMESLSDEIILEALNYDDDESRVIMALKCCQYFPKKRLKKLLESYIERNEIYYYNSVHWLDLGVSMSREIARSVAKQQLKSLSQP